MHVVSGAVLEQWNALTDEQLVLHVLSGQTALYELLIRRHGERLYRTIRAMVADGTEAERLLEDTFVQAYAHLSRIPKDTAFRAWLNRIAIETTTCPTSRGIGGTGSGGTRVPFVPAAE